MDHFRLAEQVKLEFGIKTRRALIITTVVHESLAVLAHLVDVEEVAGVSGAIYDIGRFPDPAGDWHVVHAITQAGNSDTSVVATKAHWEFGKFDVQMFVGVAGSLKTDIPIGSVVAGEYVYNSQSGKVDEKGFYSRPHAHPAAPELIKAAQRLVLNGNWVDLIRDPRRTKLPAPDVYPCPFPPNAIVKAIASGEQVVAGANTPAYQAIRKHLNDAGAVEMEGYGAMTAAHQEATSAIVIRGISDMCDGKDHQADAQYQPIASAHAAAFAFAMLSLRSKASPLSPNLGELPVQMPKPERVEAATTEQRVDYVVNFKGTLSDWSEEKTEEVIEALRKITGDPALALLRIDGGSVRVVVSVRQKDVSSLTLEAIKAVAETSGRELLGAVTVGALVEAELAKIAFKQASADLLSWSRTLPGGGWLERPEKQSIESRFNSEFSSTVLLGEPGSGKSALLAAIANDLVKADASIFAIKADFVSPEVRSEKDLQIDLRLPGLPSDLIERLAKLQPIFLFIDQLDALASQLDLQSDRLNVLLNLVRRVGQLPNVHIVLSARTFEFNHDVRLKAIEAEPITLSLPPWHEVKEKLSVAGVDADTWPESAREVIRNPQALKTYLSLGQNEGDQPFSKYQSMLEQLWRQKISMTSDGESLALLASDIAGTMAEEEALWLASSRFDLRASVLERLEASGLIVRSDNGKSIAFSHQTVFDYVLARSFVRSTGRLSSYVLQRQNSLFVRPKLWSALRYLRDAETTSYEREFLEIWREKNLRRHLRILLIEFLGELNDPLEFEKVLLDEAMHTDDLRVAALKAIIGSPGWFANFSRSAIPSAMTGSDLEIVQAVGILQRAWSFSVDDVIRLLREQWLITSTKDSFTWSVLEVCTTWSESVEQIARTILFRTPIGLWNVDYMASVVAVEQPEVAFRLIRVKLEYLLQKARVSAAEKSFVDNEIHDDGPARGVATEPTTPFTEILEDTDWHSLPGMAEAEPEKFLDVLWPWFSSLFIELMHRTASKEVDHVFPG
ncbi:phosphorylase family protein, partial [Polaromonas sp. P5_E6]